MTKALGAARRSARSLGRAASVGALAIATLLVPSLAAAAPFSVFAERYLAEPARAVGDQSGTSVTISADGSRAVLGAPGDDGGATDAGAAHVFVRSGAGWTWEATLSGSAPSAGARFGSAVAISADGARVLVGAPGTSAGDPGAAYVFVRTGTSWTEERWLQNFRAGDRFGASVALSADGARALVGAPFDDPPGFSTGDEGSFTTFERTGSTWTSGPVTFTADRAAGDACGSAIAISDDGLLVALGCPLDDDVGADSGRVVFFTWGGAAWTDLVSHRGTAAGDVYGSAVALSGDGRWALVGAPGTGAVRGAAFVLSRSATGFDLAAPLAPSTGASPDRFGWAVALSLDGGRAIVGSARSAMFAGGAYFYQREGATWTERAAVVPILPQVNDLMGSAVALSADGVRAVCGIPGDDDTATNTGGAQVYVLSGENGVACVDGTYCTSTFCVESVCCDAACGGGDAADCQSCRAALTGAAEGSCAALSGTTAPTVTCRPTAGGCDVAERCVAGDPACPADALAASDTVCRASTSDCDAEERCSGTSASCGPNELQPLGHVCRVPRGPCDAPEACDGVSLGCPTDALWGADHTCRPTSGGVCDVDDLCSGDSAECIDRFLAGAECRTSAGACDPAEVCSGAAADCPPDQRSPAATVCRASMDLVCDPLESCDGIVAACPADMNLCGLDALIDPDAGPDAGIAADAGAPPPTEGCSCEVAGRPDAPSLVVPLLLSCLVLLVLCARRRVTQSRATP
jgi:hypothetical protein